jgi:hypothetical protein
MKATRQVLRTVLGAFALVLQLLICNATFAQQQQVVGTGYVEDVRYLAQARQLVVSGWAAPEKASVFTTNLIVFLGGREIYRGRMERSERPDVVAATGRADWLSSGFSIRIAVPRGVESGLQTLKARMHLGDGTEFDLGTAPKAQTVDISAPSPAPSLLARLALGAAICAPLLVLGGLPRPERSQSRPIGNQPRREALFGAATMLSFVLLVASGWTGSSLGLLLDERGIARHDETPWLGELRSVRSDEWQVITPLAISQTMHQPKFPIINQNLGPDGHNMMVIGMTGVPVAHISSLAKPATWGFFLFDLRRALAWYWWFPYFSCFAAVWLLLLRFFSLDWRLAAGLALTISAAPYSVVFSGWPAYAVFFPVTGLLAADAALRTLRWQHSVAAGVLLGLSIAGFTLVLYPAWQIPLAYLFGSFALAWFASRRNALRFGRAQVAGVIAAAAVALLLLVSWWLDASEAIAGIRGTVYPGQRSIEVGGDIDRWFLVKGLMSAMSMYQNSSLMWGASDAGSVALFVLPAMAAVVLRFMRVRRVDAIAATLCAYLAFTLFFMFVGLWPDLARWTLWGSATSYRLDLVLAMAQLLVFAWLASPGPSGNGEPAASPVIAFAIAVLVAIQAAYLYHLVPPAILETVPVSFVLLTLLAMAGGSYLLLRGRHVAFFGVYGALMFIPAFPFNPLGVAPDEIASTQELAQAFRAAKGKGARGSHGIAVIGDRNWAMVLPAVGLPVVNSVFYYPQQSLWRRLDPDAKSRGVYNRYQRVLFVLGPLETSSSYRIDSPRLDEVRVTLDPARFDFRLTGGEAVLTGARDAQALADNATLRPSHVAPDWTLFTVVQ